MVSKRDSPLLSVMHSKSLVQIFDKQNHGNEMNQGLHKATVINISKIVIRELSLLQKRYKGFILYQREGHVFQFLD